MAGVPSGPIAQHAPLDLAAILAGLKRVGPAVGEFERKYLGPHFGGALSNLGNLAQFGMDAPASIIDSAAQGQRMGQSFGEGNYGQGALDLINGMVSAAGVLPMVGHVPEGALRSPEGTGGGGADPLAEALTPEPQGITAYHGSPHQFDRFDISQIGTGEGAQAFGHGLYFAENEGVARSYRERLAASDWKLDVGNGRQEHPGNLADELFAEVADESLPGDDLYTKGERSDYYGGFLSAFYAVADGNHKPGGDLSAARSGGTDYANGYADASRLMEQRGIQRVTPGSMYQVNLRVSPDELLDWDKPLSQQPQRVREALAELGVPTTPELTDGMALEGGGRLRIEATPAGRQFFLDIDNGGLRLPISEETAQAHVNKTWGQRNQTGASAYGILTGHFSSAEAAARFMRQRGIQGIRYADAASRGAEGGTSNYVAFSDDVIDILKRYGIAGLIGGGMAGAAMAPGESEAKE